MSVYFVGTDISKYKYDSCIMSATDLAVVTPGMKAGCWKNNLIV